MSITSASAVYTLSVPGVFATPRKLEKWAVDDAFATDPITVAETQMGVDGGYTGGFVWEKVAQTLAFLGDSISNKLFDIWYKQQVQAQDVYFARAVITLKGPGLKFNLEQGYLVKYQPIPEVRRVLQMRKHTIEWKRIIPSST